MLALGPLGLRFRRVDCLGGKRVHDARADALLSGAPHMHEIGSAFEQRIHRADGTVEPFITLSGWSFETQLFYDTQVG